MGRDFPKAKKKKNVAMLFSGGLDSTFLMYKNLREGHTVTPYYIEILNNSNKSTIEKQQMAKLIDEFKKEFPDQLDTPSFLTKTEIFIGWDSPVIFNQVPIWLLSILYINRDYNEIQIGYVANDDAISYLDDMKKLYDTHMSWLVKDDRSRPKLTFPISKTHKFQMLDILPIQYKRLIYSCENPNIMGEQIDIDSENVDKFYLVKEFLPAPDKFQEFEPCGECGPCRKILNNYVDVYSFAQPAYKRLRIISIKAEYDRLKYAAEHDSFTKEILAEIEEREKNLWQAVKHNENYEVVDATEIKRQSKLEKNIQYGKESNEVAG